MGEHRKEFWPSFYVSNEEQDYFFLLRDFPIDSITPKNEGLYMILVVRKEDEKKVYDEEAKIMYDGNTKLSHPGIYIPIQ